MKKFDFKFKVVETFKYFGAIALAVILAGAVLICTIGMNIGIDFAGGAQIKIDLGDYVATHQTVKDGVHDVIINEIEKEGFSISSERWSGDSNTVLEVGLSYKHQGKKINSKSEAEQKKFLELIQGNSIQEGLEDILDDKITAYNAEIIDVEFETRIVNASTANKLLKNAIIAAAVAIVIMLIYIVIRFTFTSGLAMVICLCHDVLVMIALTTMFRVQVNTTFIAAVITIIGYSINATIIIFDRIRETKKLPSMQEASDAEIANVSIKNTLGRTILMTLTTLVTVITLVIVCVVMGVSTMEEFALPIIFGLLAGTYSSVLLATPLWVFFKKIGAKITKNKPKKVTE